ncbi:MAG: 50S ribosomal protein L4 [Chloroflexi bacterium]|nr:50S ribosomal protein L4 [Chloroflexota bacterium]
MQVPVKDLKGTEVERIDVNDAIFGVPMNKDIVYQAMMWQRSATHLGTVDTKTRGEVSGSTRKPWRQKHTGRARAGTTRSPVWRHGGIVFGPHQRSFAVAMPRKMRRLALRCLLSDKRATGDLTVVKDMTVADGKTKDVAAALKALDLHDSTLLVMHNPDERVVRAARNIEGVRTVPASQLSALDLLNYRHVVMTVDAVRRAEELWSGELNRDGGAAPTPPLPKPAAAKKPAAPAAPKAVSPASTKPAAKAAPAKAKAEAKPKAVSHAPEHKGHETPRHKPAEHKADDHKSHETKAAHHPARADEHKAHEGDAKAKRAPRKKAAE